MTKNEFLDVLCAWTLEVTKNWTMAVRPHRDGRTKNPTGKVQVFKMRVPQGEDAYNYVPYIIHQVVTGRDYQEDGRLDKSMAQVRSIFAVYNTDEQEGSLQLLELMELVRVNLLKQVSLKGQFVLERSNALEMLIYTDNTAPYYAGEMVTTWNMPAIQREVRMEYERPINFHK